MTVSEFRNLAESTNKITSGESDPVDIDADKEEDDVVRIEGMFVSLMEASIHSN